MKIILSLSGGMDSTTLLGYLLKDNNQIKLYSFLYGSKHNKYELAAARNVANFYNIEYHQIDLTIIFQEIKSHLMKDGGDIPEGAYDSMIMKQTVVPGRNHIFVSVLAGIAESIEFDTIALAVHAGDHFIYPDCRPEFIQSLNKTIQLQTENRVSILTPFINIDKIQILKTGLSLNIPYHLTRTCYKDQLLSCGKCGSCNERLEAWSKVNIEDPIQYEE